MPKHFITLKHLRQAKEYSCVPACVRMILGHYGEQRTEAELIALLGCTPFGTTAEAVRCVVQLGYEVQVIYSTFEGLQNHVAAGWLVIVFLRTGALEYWAADVPHAVVVIGYNEEFVYLDDPYFESAPQKATIASFRRAWWRTKNRMAVIRPMSVMTADR